MQRQRTARPTFARVLLLAAALSGCSLPRSGPTAGNIRAGGHDAELGMHLVDVTPAIAAEVRPAEALGFGPEFLNASTISPDTINPGDTLSVRVWENVETGLLTGVGQKATTIDALQVDQSGDIFVPYAGRIKAAGQSPEQLRQSITESISTQTPDPQVEVRRTAGDGSTVSVMGGVKTSGVYPIEAPTQRLSSMLALAGGVTIVPDIAQIKMERRGKIGRIWLQDLYDDPKDDVALRGGDRIIVEEDRRSFTALGATTGQARVPFNKRTMTAIEAIATVGGLDGRVADPTGVFIFRDESADVANQVLGRTDLVGPQRMAYVLNFSKPDGLFSARDFIIRDEDTVYITEAPLGSWTRVIAVATAAVVLTRTAQLASEQR